jgi:hydroxypyruvate isomerase
MSPLKPSRLTRKKVKTSANLPMSRRLALRTGAGYTRATGAVFALDPGLACAEVFAPRRLEDNVKQSVCRWCYSKISLDGLCVAAKDMGLTAVDLLKPADFSIVKKYGLMCSLVSYPTIDGLGGITWAWNRREHHDKLVPVYEDCSAKRRRPVLRV